LPTLRILPFSLGLQRVSPSFFTIISLPLTPSFSQTSFSFLQHIDESYLSSSNVKTFSFSHKDYIIPSSPFFERTLASLASTVIFLSLSFTVSLSSSLLNFYFLSRPNTWPKHEFVSFLSSSLLLAYSCPSSVYQPHFLLQSIFSDSRLKRDRHARQNGGKRQPTKFESSLPLLAFVLPLRSFQRVFGVLFLWRARARAGLLVLLAHSRQATNPARDAARFLSLSLSLLVLSSSGLDVSSFNYAVTSFFPLLRRVFGERTRRTDVRMARESLLVCTPAYRPASGPYSPIYTVRFFRDSRYESFQSDTCRFFGATYFICIL